MDKTRILIADDHAILREGVRALLKMYPDMEVVGEAADGKEAIDRVRELNPDVVLMDIAMPGLGGLEATLEIRKSSPDSKILILTQYDNKEYLMRFLKAGVVGYVLKKAVGEELVAAIRSVQQGGRFLHPSMAAQLIDDYMHKGEPVDGADNLYEKLSDREKEVLKLVAEGHTSREVADTLGLSVKTVMVHRSNIMEKLGTHNRTELIKYAIRKGLIQMQPDL